MGINHKDNSISVGHWAHSMGMEPEEVLCLLLMLENENDLVHSFTQDIKYLQDLIASKEIEKMLK